jgi:hypothetical protein
MTRIQIAIACAAAGAFTAFGCQRDDMWYQTKAETYERSDFFANGQASRTPPKGTVTTAPLQEDDLLYRGMQEGASTKVFPFKITREILERGRDRFDIYCSPCHGKTGDGLGMVVQRGYREPDSFMIDRLRNAPPGYFFRVMVDGYTAANDGKEISGAGVTAGKTDYVHPTIYKTTREQDTWAIIAYIRALQLSQHANVGDLPAEDRTKVTEPAQKDAENGQH